ncbi:MAG: histidine phosphatase family protein [Candidatus Thorarchaeota archaeon]|jgi:broad specificity phosphatase PhoE
MNKEQTWDNQDWVYSAKQILEWMATIPQEQPLMFLVRHSHRETLQNHNEMVSGGLTELGKRMSFELGKRIPRDGKMFIYTSFIPRCFETAEAIAEGFTQRGGEVIDIDPLPSLVGPQVIEEEVWKNLHPDGRNVTDFVNSWVDGDFGERMELFDDYRSRLIGDTVKRLISGKEKITYVHVTHDLAMMSAKRILLKRPMKPEDREPYLGGICVTISGSEIILNIAGKTLPIVID